MGTPGSPPGDLYIEVKIIENDRYYRKGADIYGNVKISLKDALSGGNISFEGFDGNINLFIPPGTQSGDEIRIPGAGVVTTKSKGDFVARVAVSLPKIISPRGQKLLEELYDELKL
jgi:DnaJ-class molecular chaperone